MSNLPTISVGNTHTGTVKGKVNFTGKSNVETSSAHNYAVGGKTAGEVEENATINYGETHTITTAKEHNTDYNQQQEPANISQVGKYKMDNDKKKRFRPIGSKTIIKSEDKNTKSKEFFSNLGSGVTARFENDIKIEGHMTIFNQGFKGTYQARNGSDKDVKSLCETFKRFDIEPALKLDLKYTEIVREIDNLSHTNFSDCKLFVCVVMTHGDKNGVVSAADKDFNLNETIIDPIMRNRSLNGIAKIFITVACRGSNNYYQCDGEESDGHILSTKNGIDYSNCIISYSTYDGHVSKRTESGTYFIQELCKNINEDNGEAKIHSYFAKVNGSLTKNYRQVPLFQSTMDDICFKDLASTS